MGAQLIIDDNYFSRELLKTISQRNGMDPVCASSLAEAELNFDLGDISVLFTDLIMPDENGLSLIENMRKTQPDCIIIAVSAAYYEDPHIARDALLKGADAILAKPYEEDDFKCALNDAVSKHKKRI